MKQNFHIRNIGIIAHVDAGKTTISERILFYTGKTYRQGETFRGDTVMDYDPQEKKRGITINSAATTVFWNNSQINLIDTPGHIDFNIEVNRSLRVLDGAVMVLDGVAGVEPQTETNWHLADQYHVPRICFVNKLDRVGADFLRVVHMIRERFNVPAVPLQLPIGSEGDFVGVIDLLHEHALYWHKGEEGAHYEIEAIPESMQEAAKHWRNHLVEQVVDQDDTALAAWLDGQQPSPEILQQCLRKGTIDSILVPVICGSAYRNRGIEPLLDAIAAYLPSPGEVHGRDDGILSDPEAPFVGLAFKVIVDEHSVLTFVRVYRGCLRTGDLLLNTATGKKERVMRLYEVHADKHHEIDQAGAGGIVAVAGLKDTITGHTLCEPHHPVMLETIVAPEPVIDIAIEPKTLEDQQLLGKTLPMLLREDPSLQARVDAESGQIILSGMGELQLEVTLENLRRRFNVKVMVGKPQVAYRETITQTLKVRYLHKKQAAGSGQYAEVEILVEPQERGQGIIFENNIAGGKIPDEYISSVKTGVHRAAQSGILGNYPCVDIKVTLLDGSYHEQDSSTIAFELASSFAFKQALLQAGSVLLEPAMQVEVITPPDYVGNCISDLNRRRGLIRGQEDRLGNVLIQAYVPLAEMFGYIGRLRSITSGHAQFTMQFDHYVTVPANIEASILHRF